MILVFEREKDPTAVAMPIDCSVLKASYKLSGVIYMLLKVYLYYDGDTV